jgi:WD40 repeat protein
MYNNASYRQFNVSGTTSFTFSTVGNTVRMTAAINAWTGATINPIEPEPGVDGRAFIAYKVTGPVGGMYHYEYAIYNENLDRAIQSFSVPLGCGIALSNLGFHAPLNHPGFPNDGTLGDAGFSNAAWTSNQTAGALTWSTETFAQNQNANAIRWGTLYNFRFDSDRAPLFTQATIGFFKMGAPVTVGILGPNACNATPSPTPIATATATANPTPTVPPTPSPTPTPVPTPILPPAGNGKIAFVRVGQIYVMDANGANQTNLTNNPPGDSDPNWSPDGTKIAFTSTRGGQQGYRQIYVMNANGSNRIRLTNNPGTATDPSWSPDGTKIAFALITNFVANDIYVINTNGTNQIRLTNTSNNYEPVWSPDGGKIAFTASQGSWPQINVMDANGSNQITLTDEVGGANNPAWSPDGTKIAYSREGLIRVMSAYGTNRTYLTNSGADGDPAWSPDGTKIAFTSGRDGNGEIYVMDANGANQTNITNNPADDSKPDWQRIALPPPPAAQALNLSTRMRVQTGDNVGIGGFIITGTAPKHVLIRGIGPSLTQSGVPDALTDPVMELHGPGAFVTITDDNWRDDPAQEAAIIASGIPPTNDLEAAIDATLDPGAYTAVVRGTNETSGVGLIEVYDLDQNAPAKLANLSTRAFVNTGNNIVIAGFIFGSHNGNDRIVVRGIGPSLAGGAIALPDPTLELRNGNGTLVAFNNDWQDDPAQATEIDAAGLAPSNSLEAAIAATLPPGLYTALLAGLNGGTGVGLVEVYDLGAP